MSQNQIGPELAPHKTFIMVIYILYIASFVVPRSGELVAASDDLPGVLASLSGAVALCVAGVVLERHCVAPPPPDGETA